MKKIISFVVAAAMSASVLSSVVSAEIPEIIFEDSLVDSDSAVEIKDIKDGNVLGVVNKVYTGQALTQNITVTYGDEKLISGVDYSVSYKNNVNVGTACVVIAGQGKFTGIQELSFKISAPTVSAVSGLSVTGNKSNTFTVSWNKVSGASGYEVQCYNSAIKQWKTLSDTTSLKYVPFNLKSGTVYKFRVRAYIKVGDNKFYSKFSNVDGVTVPAKTSSFTVKDVTSSGYTLVWDKVSGADEYRVYMYNSKTEKYERIALGSNTYFKVEGRTAGQKNIFVVRAVKKYNGKYYLGDMNKQTFVSKPAQVKTVKTAVKKNNLKISWSKVSGADGYQIYYSTSKNGSYKLLKQINGNKTFSWSTTSLAGKKVYIKVRAFVKSGNTAVGPCSQPKAVRVFSDLSYNQVLNGYSNSNSVTSVNAQGYKISSAKKKELTNALTCLGGTAGFVLLDLDSGAMVGYNANSYFGTASTVKMPYMLYALNCMEDGTPDMNTVLTYNKSDYSSGSGVIKNSKFGTKYTLKQVFHNICAYSDNCGYYMLQDYFGYSGYNKYIASLGCRTSVSPSVRWGVVSAADSAREWIQMYNYLYNGKYGAFMRNELKKSTSSNFRIGLGGKYTVYSKCGWTDVYHHDTAVVESEHPYVLICLTDRVSAARLQRVARAADAIHDEMWKYYNS
ncbi:MAG: serine hydrolase [Oscillospiraceae bacterium]